MTITVAGVIAESVVDGPGLRCTIFTQGCPHHCPGCHNPQTHPFEGGIPRDTNELLSLMTKNPLLSGVTFSGGEPFCQSEACRELAEKCHQNGLNVLSYSGFTYEQLAEDPERKAFLDQCDWLIDGPFLLAERDLELQFRGSRNQRIIDLRATRKTGELVVLDRI